MKEGRKVPPPEFLTKSKPVEDDDDGDYGEDAAIANDVDFLEARSKLEALNEDIPGPPPSEVKPRDQRDPYEEIAVTERFLKTKRSLLASLRPYERNKKKVLETEVAKLEADLKYFEDKKRRLEEEGKIE